MAPLGVQHFLRAADRSRVPIPRDGGDVRH